MDPDDVLCQDWEAESDEDDFEHWWQRWQSWETRTQQPVEEPE